MENASYPPESPSTWEALVNSAYFSFKCAFPWIRRSPFGTPASWEILPNQDSILGKIPFEVACVGNPKKTPLRPVIAANSSAPIRAASVFPSPMGASRINSPGCLQLAIVSTKIFWTSRGTNPNRCSKAWLDSKDLSGDQPNVWNHFDTPISYRDCVSISSSE